MNPVPEPGRMGGKYDDIIEQTRRELDEERAQPVVSRAANRTLRDTFWLTFAFILILGLAASSLGAFTNVWQVTAIGGILMGLWLILLVSYLVVSLMRR